MTVATTLSSKALLDHLHAVEAQFSRSRDVRWGARTIDLDLLTHGMEVLPDLETYREWERLPLDAQPGATPDQLILPHPRIADRAFVLVPLLDVAPLWRHPVSGKTIPEMLSALPDADIQAIRPLD